MSAQVKIDVLTLSKIATALSDAIYEIEQPEINELVTGALEKKLANALESIEKVLGAV